MKKLLTYITGLQKGWGPVQCTILDLRKNPTDYYSFFFFACQEKNQVHTTPGYNNHKNGKTKTKQMSKYA